MKQMDVALDPMAACAPPIGKYTLAIDPGPAQSGWCLLLGDELLDSGVRPNADMLDFIKHRHFQIYPARVAIEMIASYGMPVGKEVFETCLWIGRFVQAWRDPDSVLLVYRKDVKMHLCGTVKAKDGNVRQAIIDLYPASGGGATPQIGTKAKPGPLYGVSSHAWPALGVALTVQAQGAQA